MPEGIKQKTDLSLVFTPHEQEELKLLPPLSKELEDRMRLIANLMIDKILASKDKNYCKRSKKSLE